MFYPPIEPPKPFRDSSAIEASQSARRAVESTRFDIERLLMITEALWTLLKKEHGYTDEQLMDQVAEIDMRDGVFDGRVAPTEAPNCPECDAKLQKKRQVCIYCGTPIQHDLFQR